MFFVEKNPNIEMDDFIISLFSNIWGDEIDITKKACGILYQLPYHFSIKYKGIEIDLSVTCQYTEFKNTTETYGIQHAIYNLQQAR